MNNKQYNMITEEELNKINITFDLLEKCLPIKKDIQRHFSKKNKNK